MSNLNLNLPAPSTPFIGRDTEAAQIRQWLADPSSQLISLVGMGGIGKTRLAIEAVKQNADSFPDGVFFVQLQALELPDLILPAIATSVGITASPGVELKRQLAGFFDDKPGLLVLDSFEHLLAGVDAVIDLFQLAPAVKFLITSREKLNIQHETVLYVGPLPYPEEERVTDAEQYPAVSLFLSHLHRLEPELPITPDVLADACRLCRQIEGLPLAIELAVGWADTLSLKEIRREIASNIDFLETRRRDGSDRHRSIRAVLESSLQTLPSADCVVMEKLCVFRGSFTREAAEAIAGATLHSLALLVNKSLVRRRSSGGYVIHELVRQYGEARLSSIPGQREAVQARFDEYYATFLATQWQEMNSALHNVSVERIDAELPNSLIAFQSMIENGNVAQIWQSMNALWGYFALHSKFSEGRLIFERSAEALRASQDEPLIGSLRLRTAFFLACLGTSEEADKAEHMAEEGLMLLRRHPHIGSAEMLITAYLCSSVVYWFSGKYQRMKDNAQKALDYATETHTPFGIRLTLCLLGRAEVRLGNYALAQEIGLEGYELAFQQGDKWIKGFTAFNILAEVAFAQKDYEEAQRWCRIAQQCFEKNHEPWTLTTSLMLTACAIALRDLGEAKNQLDVCLVLLEESGLVSQIPTMLLRVARLLAEQQMIEYAVAVLPLIIGHPMCRQVTYAEATLLLGKLEALLPPNRIATTWKYGQSIQPTQVTEVFASIQKSALRQPPTDVGLSERELDVLRLIAEGLSNAEIAQRLHVAIGTIKVHNRHIYDKLGVNSRTQALAVAQKLGIL